MKKCLLLIFFQSIILSFSSAQLIQPEHLEYLGAFRLPEGNYDTGWYWVAGALTYYPDGDPAGSDNHIGSLFGIGHSYDGMISEINIPTPVISAGKELSDLNTAGTIQDFTDIVNPLFPDMYFEMRRMGIEYLPAQGNQESGKLYISSGQHFQEDSIWASHLCCDLDLSNPNTAGPWYFGSYSNYRTDDYIFEIPEEWADENTPGLRLCAGRYRDGGWGGEGPNLYAYGPWNDGNPPAPYSVLENITPLLMYHPFSEDPDVPMLDEYHHSDEWVGGAWLTAGENSAVILMGTKGTGNCWYGLPDGTVWEEPYPEDPYNQRGWWSTEFEAQIIFYNPDDFARVANGEILQNEPQPYASLNINEYLFNHDSVQQKYLLAACAYDRERNYLYIMETFATDDGDPIIHVFKVNEVTGVEEEKAEGRPSLTISPNPAVDKAKVRINGWNNEIGIIEVCSPDGRVLKTIKANASDFLIDIKDIPQGIYFIRFKGNKSIITGKMLITK